MLTLFNLVRSGLYVNPTYNNAGGEATDAYIKESFEMHVDSKVLKYMHAHVYNVYRLSKIRLEVSL